MISPCGCCSEQAAHEGERLAAVVGPPEAHEGDAHHGPVALALNELVRVRSGASYTGHRGGAGFDAGV